MTMNSLNTLLLIAYIALIFVPLARLFARRPQPIFRRGWLNDIICWLVNTYVLTLCRGVLIGVTMAARWLIPIWVREAVASQV